jgi:DNA-directed RNA polymerase subunit RPC12/RpoP
MARKDPEPVPPAKLKYTCEKCGTTYDSLSDAQGCPCRNGGND